MPRKCICGKKACLGFEKGKPIWCAKCPDKDEKAMNVVNKKCVCGKAQPSFGLHGGKPIWCANCPDKEHTARNVVDKKCACGKSRPSFGLHGGKPVWCVKCPDKDEDAMDVANKKCVCGKAQPRFGLHDGKPVWCAKCPDKEQTARNVVDTKCVCGEAIPSFGLQGGKRIWCAKCPEKDEKAVNVANSKCVCGKAQPSLGLEDRKPLWCAKCPDKDEKATNVVNRKCVCGKAIPSLGIEQGKPLWCARCPDKDENATDVVTKKCATALCEVIAKNPSYRGHCLRCFAHLYPDEPMSRNFKTKERIVIEALKDLLLSKYPHLSSPARFDKAIDGGCSRRRPDAFIDVFTHVVMGEIDEEGHNTSEYCSCENKRTMQLMQDVNMRPIVLIRLNPDAYRGENGREASCFKRGKDGQLIIADKERWNRRLSLYLERISFHLDNVPSSEVTVEHLYYDGFK